MFGMMQAACSTTATFCVVQVGGQVYACGKWKSSGDNTMYPKAFMDLQGWNIRHMAAGATHYAVAADQSTITWYSLMCQPDSACLSVLSDTELLVAAIMLLLLIQCTITWDLLMCQPHCLFGQSLCAV
jgi:hypothetical protein